MSSAAARGIPANAFPDGGEQSDEMPQDAGSRQLSCADEVRKLEAPGVAGTECGQLCRDQFAYQDAQPVCETRDQFQVQPDF